MERIGKIKTIGRNSLELHKKAKREIADGLEFSFRFQSLKPLCTRARFQNISFKRF